MNKEQAMAAIRQLSEFIERTGEPWHKKGYVFEKKFASLCESRGLSCFKQGKGHFDFVVGTQRVQCKALNPDENGRVWVQPGMGPAYVPGSFDVLVVETPKGIHIIPEVDIPRTSSGMVRAVMNESFLSMYADAWSFLESGKYPPEFERQKKFEGFAKSTEVADGR